MAPDPERIREVRSWLEKANDDIRAAGVDLAADPPLTGDAAFHAQQAIEKSLKGFLSWHEAGAVAYRNMSRRSGHLPQVSIGFVTILVAVPLFFCLASLGFASLSCPVSISDVWFDEKGNRLLFVEGADGDCAFGDDELDPTPWHAFALDTGKFSEIEANSMGNPRTTAEKNRLMTKGANKLDSLALGDSPLRVSRALGWRYAISCVRAAEELPWTCTGSARGVAVHKVLDSKRNRLGEVFLDDATDDVGFAGRMEALRAGDSRYQVFHLRGQDVWVLRIRYLHYSRVGEDRYRSPQVKDAILFFSKGRIIGQYPVSSPALEEEKLNEVTYTIFAACKDEYSGYVELLGHQTGNVRDWAGEKLLAAGNSAVPALATAHKQSTGGARDRVAAILRSIGTAEAEAALGANR